MQKDETKNVELSTDLLIKQIIDDLFKEQIINIATYENARKELQTWKR